jgi:hypothetical protein
MIVLVSENHVLKNEWESEGIVPRISDKMVGGVSSQLHDPAALPPYPLDARVQPENIPVRLLLSCTVSTVIQMQSDKKK